MEPMGITVAGVGGGGGRIVSRLMDPMLPGVQTVVVNTDARALAECRAMAKIQIGKGRTEGLGAGGDPVLGRTAAEDDIEDLKLIFADTQLLIVVVGLGGGTGSGVAPLILRGAREAGVSTICFATMPFRFEGDQRRSLADKTVAALQDVCSALIVVPNDRLFETVGDQGVATTFDRTDEILGRGVTGLCRMLSSPGRLDLDLADLRRVIQVGLGRCTMGIGEGTGPDKAKQAVSALLEGPLLEKGEVLSRAGSVLVSVVGDPDLKMKDLETILDAIKSRLPSHGEVLAGAILDDACRDRVTVTLIAAEAVAVANADAPLERGLDADDSRRITSRGRRKSAASQQARLRLDSPERGRFNNVEATNIGGEDLDVPTYRRRGMTIEK
jgi:cell division protein FtsZ